MNYQALALIPLAALLACNGPETVDDTGETDETDDEPVELTGKEGSIAIIHWPADAQYEDEGGSSYALFHDSNNGIANLSECFLGFGKHCYETLPAADTFSEPDVDLDWIESAERYEVGTSFNAGPYRLELYRFGDDNFDPLDDGSAYYEGDGGVGSGMGDLALDGDLAEFEGTGVFEFVTPMVTTGPDASTRHDVSAGDTVEFRWESATAGDVSLHVAGNLYHLTDDGEYDLDVDELDLQPPFDDTVAVLARQVVTEFDASGNDITLLTTSDQWFYLDYADTSGWTETTTADTCGGLDTMTALGAGQYHGDLTDNTDNFDLESDNEWTGYQTAGLDGILPIDVGAGQTLTATLRQHNGDSALYLMNDCDGFPGSVVAGVDDTFSGGEETLVYEATAAGTYFLVLDAFFEDDGGLFGLTIDIQ